MSPRLDLRVAEGRDLVERTQKASRGQNICLPVPRRAVQHCQCSCAVLAQSTSWVAARSPGDSTMHLDVQCEEAQAQWREQGPTRAREERDFPPVGGIRSRSSSACRSKKPSRRCGRVSPFISFLLFFAAFPNSRRPRRGFLILWRPLVLRAARHWPSSSGDSAAGAWVVSCEGHVLLCPALHQACGAGCGAWNSGTGRRTRDMAVPHLHLITESRDIDGRMCCGTSWHKSPPSPGRCALPLWRRCSTSRAGTQRPVPPTAHAFHARLRN